jgi:hypothetical protein
MYQAPITTHFQPYAANNFGNLWRLFIDFYKQDDLGPLGFEREKGYLRGLINGLDFMLTTLGQPVTPDFLKTLQQNCHTHFSKIPRNTLPSQFRIFRSVSYGLAGDICPNYTAAGLLELSTLFKQEYLRSKFYLKSEDSNNSDRFELIDINHLNSDLISEKIKNNTVKIVINCEGNKESLTAQCQKLIDHYYAEIAINPDKISAIAKLVRNLEVTHPFFDYNCRTFNLLLNKLLLENGFSPTILINPNIIDAYSVQELVIEITKGMERFRSSATHPLWINREDPANPTWAALMYFYGNHTLSRLWTITIMQSLPQWQQIDPADQEHVIALTSVSLANYPRYQGYSASDLFIIRNSILGQLATALYANTNIFAACFQRSSAERVPLISIYKIKFASFWPTAHPFTPSYNPQNIFSGLTPINERLTHYQ